MHHEAAHAIGKFVVHLDVIVNVTFVVRRLASADGQPVWQAFMSLDDTLERLAASYPVRRLGTAREVADLICFAASESAGYITGASLDINGGDLMM